jgi:hypothetical protein
MEASDSVQPSMDNLRQLLRDVSVIQVQQYLNGQDVYLDEPPGERKLGQVLTRYIAMVLLTCDELRIVFKLHFDPEQVQSYLKTKKGDQDVLTDVQIIDFMKELSNQMGGRVCRVFDAHQKLMGMSIPMCTRGIYEIYADYRTKVGAVAKFGDFWRLSGPLQSLYCSCYVELLSKEDFSDVKALDEVAEEGELDFL